MASLGRQVDLGDSGAGIPRGPRAMRLLPVRHAYGRWLPHACTWATGHITATTPLVRQSLGAIARYERQVIRKRMQGGRAARAARGGYA